ncbi:Uncharacterized homolog of phage Mu protein gp47 [Moraxella lacunata]|uniref:Uncharacterized homolog of phage Mu protein gp47 n=1 Tax=Moraxella lacunata TaxID=477 RepID=A0A378TV73_MORLA|nr:baseplate J/gp47 family protein [Moraxella lacunata]STZ63782.1 Uncharacterized homolog of phage Mu protein gp47 [Moraxella lacunata]
MALPKRENLKIVDDDIATILSETIKDYEARAGKVLQPAHIERLLINTFAYRELLLRKQLNEAYRQQHIPYATGLMLDVAGADFGTNRLTAQPADTLIEFSVKPDEIGNVTITIDKGTEVLAGNVAFATVQSGQLTQSAPRITLSAICTQTGMVGNGYAVGQINALKSRPHPTISVSAKNTTISQNGADVENDDSYRERIMLAFERFSNAGSKGAYAYFARSVSQEIIDVYVGNAIDRTGQPIGGTVAVYLLGKTMPVSDTLIREVNKALNDEKVRPLCDTVTVNSAKVVNFTLNAELTTFTGANADEVLANAKSAFNVYQKETESKLGQDVVPLNLAKTLQVAGVYDVKLISPSLINIPDDTVAICKTINISIVGQTDG